MTICVLVVPVVSQVQVKINSTHSPGPASGFFYGSRGGALMSRRRYTDADRASGLAALEANGGIKEAYRTAQQIGVPVNTLKGWHGAQHEETADIRTDG